MSSTLSSAVKYPALTQDQHQAINQLCSNKRKISQVLQKEIQTYETRGKRTVAILKVAAKVVLFVSTAIVLFSVFGPSLTAIIPKLSTSLLPHTGWFPWAGFGSYVFFTCVQGIINHLVSTKEKLHDARLNYVEMLKHSAFNPMTEADLPQVDDRLISDQMTKNGLLPGLPSPNPNRLVSLVRDYDLDTETSSKALAAAQLSKIDNATCAREWKSVKEQVKKGKKELYQDHPGRITKWIREHFYRYKPKTSVQRIENYCIQIRKAKEEGLRIEGAVSKIANIKMKKLQEKRDLKSSLKNVLSGFNDIDSRLTKLEKKYSDAKQNYYKSCPTLDDSYKSFKQVEDVLNDKVFFSQFIKLLEQAISEPNPHLATAKSLESLRLIHANAKIKQLTEKFVAALTSANKNNSLLWRAYIVSLIETIKSLQKEIASFPDLLKDLNNWLNIFPFKDPTDQRLEFTSFQSQLSDWSKKYQQNWFLLFGSSVESAIQEYKHKPTLFFIATTCLSGFSESQEQEEKWTLSLIEKVDGFVAYFSQAEMELKAELQKWTEKIPKTRIEKLKELISNTQSSEASFQEKITACDEKRKSLENELSSLNNGTIEKWMQECSALEKEVKELQEKKKKRPLTERISLFWERIKKTKAPNSFESKIPNAKLHPTLKQRKIKELLLNDLLKKVDLSILRTNRFRRVAIEWLAVSVLLIVEAFVFTNPWAGFGITMGVLAVMATRYGIDRRLQNLQEKKKKLQMESRLHNPVPTQKDFSFEKQWRQIRSGHIESNGVLPGNRPRLHSLKSTALRLGLDSTERRQSEWMIHSNHQKISRFNTDKKSEKPQLVLETKLFRFHQEMKKTEEERISADKTRKEESKPTFDNSEQSLFEKIKENLFSISVLSDKEVELKVKKIKEIEPEVKKMKNPYLRAQLYWLLPENLRYLALENPKTVEEIQ